MDVLDLIKIKGLSSPRSEDIDPGLFECFQGLDGDDISVTATIVPSTAPVPLAETPENAMAIWTAQTSVIQEEISLLDDLIDILTKKEKSIPNGPNWVESFISETLEMVAGFVVGWVVEYYSKQKWAGELASFVTEAVVGYGLELLFFIYKKSKATFTALKAENEALLLLEASRQNYEFRRETIKVHAEQIENLMRYISLLEGQVVSQVAPDSKRFQELLQALQYNSEQIELPGGARLHLEGRYTGYNY